MPLVTEYTGAEPAAVPIAATQTPRSGLCPALVTVPVMDPSCASVVAEMVVTTELLTETSAAPALVDASGYHTGARSGSLKLHVVSPT